MNECDVVVIGAGMAGLAAARMIAEAGLRVVVLEARKRVGGRIKTVRDGETVIELGAEFVHGKPPELWDLIDEAGLSTYERTGDFLLRGDAGLHAMEFSDDEDEPLEKLEDFAGPDCSFTSYVDALGLDPNERRQQIAYAEGFNAADANEASAMALGRQQQAEDAVDGDRSWRVTEGYEKLPQFVCERVQAAGGTVILGATVEAIQWSGGSAEVTCRDGRVWPCEKVVVALPLGVLHAGAVRFEPEVTGIMQAAARLRMGHACRFTLVFRQRLWPEQMSFLLTDDVLPRVWWTARPHESRTLTGWSGGPQALDLLGLSQDELKGRAIVAAAAALGISDDEIRTNLQSFHTHNWDADVWSRGAYTWVPVGGLDASARMCEPVTGTLFFAGEHTDTTGHWGTVHAALRSGLRAGRQVVEAFGR